MSTGDNKRKGNGAVGVQEPPTYLNELPVTQETVDHALTPKGLEALGHSAMGDTLNWYSEPIYPSRRHKIEDLISRLEGLSEEFNAPDLKWSCNQLRGRLERAVLSARKLLEALDAAELSLKEQEDQLREERYEITGEIGYLRQQIELVEGHLFTLAEEAQQILATAGLNCRCVTRDGVERSIDDAAPTPAELAGELGVPFYHPKSFWEQILSLPSEIAPLAIGPVVGIALGLVAGFVTLRTLREFTDPAPILAVFLLGVVITSTVAEGLATMVKLWVPSVIKRYPDLPGQLVLSRRLFAGMFVLGGIFFLGEALVEALGFIHLHNLLKLEQMRLTKGVSNAATQAELIQMSAYLYFGLGLVISAPLVLLKIAKAIHRVQVGLVNNYIADQIRLWKQAKTTEVARAVVLASDCDTYRDKLTELTNEKESNEQKLSSLTVKLSPAQVSRINVLEEQARGKAGKFWQSFEAVVQPPKPTVRDLGEMPEDIGRDGFRTPSWWIRLLQRVRRLFGRR